MGKPDKILRGNLTKFRGITYDELRFYPEGIPIPLISTYHGNSNKLGKLLGSTLFLVFVVIVVIILFLVLLFKFVYFWCGRFQTVRPKNGEGR